MALYEFSNFMMKNEDGQFSGFNIDYLQELSRYTDWDIHYVEYGSWENAYDALLAGDVDILPSVYYESDLSSEIIYSDDAACDLYIALCIRPDDDRFAYEDFEQFNGMQVGVIADSLDAQFFEKYSADNNFEVNMVPYDSVDNLLEDLDNGTLDAIAIAYMGGDTDLRTVARFSPLSVHFAFPLDRSDIAREYNDAFDGLAMRNPSIPARIFGKYFGVNTNQTPLFTRNESAYIESAPVLKVAYDSDRRPFSFTQKDGEVGGVASLLFESISSDTGLNFEFIACDNHAQCVDMVSSGEADIIYAIDDEFESDLISTTGIYLDNAIAQASLTADNVEKIALPIGFNYVAKVVKTLPADKQYFYYETPDQCCDAVMSGAVDATYLDVLSASYLSASNAYHTLHLSSATNITNDMCIGVSDFADARLVGILDKCIEYTPRAETAHWVSESSITSEPESLGDAIYNNPMIAVAIFGALALLAIIAASYTVFIKTRHNRRLEKIAYTDPLTGGWNLPRFQKEASEILSDNMKHRYAIIYLDFRRFKSFNAAYGFKEGDRLLIATDLLLNSFVREGECFARVNEDEFIVLTRWESWEELQNRFLELDKDINDLPFLRNHNHHMTLAAGACMVEQHHVEEGATGVSELIDHARYARETTSSVISRSTIVLYTSEMTERDLKERMLLNAGEAALGKREFIAYYQPQVDLATNQIVGFEALARWNSPDAGLLQPASFIPIFERSGLIIRLDLALFRIVCERMRNQLDREEEPVRISCNFSRHHLMRDEFPLRVKEIADDCGVPPCYLELELTESVLMENLDRAETVCKQLKDLGFSIAIDDFGSGYSSLGTLQRLPMDVVKMDRSFLLSSQEDEKSKIILEKTIELANALGVDIVVEGVETPEQAAMLHGFKHEGLTVQGFLYSRPVDLEASTKQFAAGYINPQDEA